MDFLFLSGKCANRQNISMQRKTTTFQSVCLHVSYPFAHEAIVEGQAYELESSLLDEEGIEDSYLCRLPRHIVCHRLPETFCAPLRCWQRTRQGVKKRERWIIENSGLVVLTNTKTGFVLCVKNTGGDIHMTKQQWTAADQQTPK